MTSKEFLDYLKRIPEKQAIAILDNTNNAVDKMSDKINELEGELEKVQAQLDQLQNNLMEIL